MAEFKNMTVQALRELARRALGRGHSKLKTKAELIDALQAAERKMAVAAEKAAARMKDATGRAVRATEKVVETVRRRREQRRSATARGGQKQSPPGARGRGPKELATAAPEPAARRSGGAAHQVQEANVAARKTRTAAGGEPQPDPEGYMVARVAGEDALRGAPHPMTEGALESERGARARREPTASQARPSSHDERLGELPLSYADDALVALPRDPRTLFLYWDHAQQTLRDAWEGLDGARPQIWVFVRDADERWTRMRTIEFALESRSYYVHDLEPGRVYRAEIHVVDRHGREKLLPKISNEMMLPPTGPSPVIDDRFMRILWSEPLQRLLRQPQAGGAFPEEIRAQLARLSDWSRFPGRVWGGSAGGIGGRPSSPVSSPSAGSPSSPWSRPSGEGR